MRSDNRWGGPGFWWAGRNNLQAVQNVNSNSIAYTVSNGTTYHLKLDAGTCQALGNGNLNLAPDASGKIIFNLGSDN